MQSTPELLEQISALSELRNSLEDAATVLKVPVDELASFLRDDPEARDRWERGRIEARNQLVAALTRQALAGSYQSGRFLLEMEPAAQKTTAPASAATTAPTNDRTGEAWKWKKLSLVAGEIGVSAQYIRNLIHEHKLPMEKRAGEWCVKPGEAYEFVERFAKKRPPNLQAPKGYVRAETPAEAPAATSTLPVLPMNLELDPEAILREAYRNQAIGEEGNESGKLLIALAEAVRRLNESEEKKQNRMDLDDVIKKLQTLGETYCETMHGTSAAQADELLKVICEQIGVDLRKHNSASKQILQRAVCVIANERVIVALRRRVKDECDGVQLLKLAGSAEVSV